MAYLKGGSYIDGDLFINGSLSVRKLVDTSGSNLPYLYSSESSQINHIIKFATSDGALTSTSIIEEVLNNVLNITFDDDVASINVSGGDLNLENISQLNFNTETSKIQSTAENIINLKKINSLDEVGNGQYYYFDNNNYYTIFIGEGSFNNWPDAICYEGSLKIK